MSCLVRRGSRRPRTFVALSAGFLLSLALALAGCASGGPSGSSNSPGATPIATAPSGAASSPGPASTGSATAKPPPASRAPSAADQLAAFVAAAERVDGQLRHAATLVNTGIGAQRLEFTPATFAAIRAIDVQGLGKTVAAGMPERLQTQTLLVFSDLVSRYQSLKSVLEADRQQPLERADGLAEYIMACLPNGAPAAARFTADLSALRSLSASLPRFTVAAPDSRTAAAVAALVEYIRLSNGGCMSCGGEIFTKPIPVVWTTASAGAKHLEGTVAGIDFSADYKPGDGWSVIIRAC